MTTTSSQPPVFSERYELVRHIARGGMAQVYLAKDLLLDRQVALKVLFPELSVDPAFVRRFRREAQAAASLSHRNIVSIYDWGQGESTYCIVMEYVDGRTLSALAREQPLAPRRAAQIGSDVAAALDFAHGHGVIHRDVKPGNVLIDHQGQVKVADFGIARAVGTKEGLTQTGAVMGTATYFSPEQAQGFAVDARSDVYSLGVVLYEIVAGRAPFTGDNPVSIAYKHVREQPTPLAELVPGISPDYAAVVAKAMAKSAEDRYQTAAELQADLDRFVAGQPVVAALDDATRVVPDNTIVAAPIPPGPLPRTVVAPEEPTYPPRQEPDRRGLWYALLAVLVVVLAVAVFFLGRSLGWWDSAPTRAIPAGLVGEPAPTAASQLKAAGFTNVTEQTEQSSVANGDVISVNPASGARTKTSNTVTLVVSVGPKQVTVPDETGKASADASTALTAAGFRPLIKMQPSSTVAPGTVISQDPAGSSQLGQGDTVTLNVSSGPAQITIPSVYDEVVSTASGKLGALGLNVGNPVYEYSSTVQSGNVVGTSPGAGSVVSAGSTVTIYVSKGMQTVAVPNLSGDTGTQAQAALAAAGLQIAVDNVATTDPSQNNLVISQNPAAGASANVGATVTVQLGQYQATSTTTTTPSSSTSSTSSTT